MVFRCLLRPLQRSFVMPCGFSHCSNSRQAPGLKQRTMFSLVTSESDQSKLIPKPDQPIMSKDVVMKGLRKVSHSSCRLLLKAFRWVCRTQLCAAIFHPVYREQSEAIRTRSVRTEECRCRNSIITQHSENFSISLFLSLCLFTISVFFKF